MLWMLSCSRLAASSLLPGPGDLSTLSRRYLGRCRCRTQVQETGAGAGAGHRHVAAANLVPGSSSFRTL